MTTSQSLFRRAAEILEREASCLRDSHTIQGQWDHPDVPATEEDHAAHRDHDEMITIARRLRRMIGTR